MGYFIRMVLCVLMGLTVLGRCDAQEGKIGPAPESLSVLYAGKPGSDRMKEFEKFLGEHFKKVATCDFENFTRSDANGFDVVVFDWPYTSPTRENVEAQADFSGPSINIDTFFSRPTVMIGYAGGVYCSSHPMAIDWKCLCLENYAHDVNTNHPIFQGPLPVAIEYETIEKPDDYYAYPGTVSLGEKMQAWKIQSKTFPDVAPGLVSCRENFVDTPDAEAISGGINGKGPSSVAIARHGNYFLWGFSAVPSEMTDSAKHALVNSICYMTAFDGKRPGPFKANFKTPENYLATIYHLRLGSDAYISKQVNGWQKRIEQRKISPTTVAAIGNDPAAYFRKLHQPYVNQILAKVPESIRKQTGDDIEKIIAYYTQHAEHLRINAKNEFDVEEME